jgi:hypothetical protein
LEYDYDSFQEIASSQNATVRTAQISRMSDILGVIEIPKKRISPKHTPTSFPSGVILGI